MSLFVKSKDKLGKEPVRSQDFRNHSPLFNITEYIYHDKRHLFEELLAQHPEFIPDLAASILNGVSSHLKSDLLVKALRCCRDILLDMDYTETHLDEIKQLTSQDQDRLIVIAGCQNDDLLQARVEVAAKLFKNLHMSARFIPVGKGPAHETNRIRDESARIKTILHQQLGHHLEIVPLELEQESHRTYENIANLLGGSYIDATRSTSLFIVSSTFHLIRLAKEVDSRSNVFSIKHPNINSIFLIGSESGVNKTVRSASYIRFLFYDIYDYILHKTRVANESVETDRAI